MTINLINGQIWQGGLVKTNLQIKDGRIFVIGKNLSKADKEIDLFGKVVFPGFIDSHVHLRDFQQSYKEDWRTGSLAAAAGGITTVLDMPNNQPAILTRELLEQKRKIAQAKSVVGFAFHFGSSENNLPEIRKLGEQSVVSVKVFMNESFGKLKIEDKEVLQEIFNSFPLITVHAEGEKVRQAVELIKQTPNKLYLCHISTKEEIDYLRTNKIPGKIFVEATPHHLFLTDSSSTRMKSGGEDKNFNQFSTPNLLRGSNNNYLNSYNFSKMKPSLGSKKDQTALWQAIKEGIIDTIASDHAPHTKEEKILSNPPSGVPGLETMMPLLFNAYHQGKISLAKIVELAAANPARIFALKNKGEIVRGYNADLTVVDLNLAKPVRESELKTKAGWSPFAGWNLKGWPVMTIVNGKILNTKS